MPDLLSGDGLQVRRAQDAIDDGSVASQLFGSHCAALSNMSSREFRQSDAG